MRDLCSRRPSLQAGDEFLELLSEQVHRAGGPSLAALLFQASTGVAWLTPAQVCIPPACQQVTPSKPAQHLRIMHASIFELRCLFGDKTSARLPSDCLRRAVP